MILIYRLGLTFCILLSVCLSNTFAHQPDLSSTMLVENEQGEWILQVRAAITAFEMEVNYNYGENSFATPEEFQEIVINHVKDHIRLIVDGNTELMLTDGQVKLGHETSVYFSIENMPLDKTEITVTNATFENINRNQMALIFAAHGEQPIQTTLDASNSHNVSVARSSNYWAFDDAKSVSVSSYGFSSYILGGLTSIILLGFLFRKWRNANLEKELNAVKLN